MPQNEGHPQPDDSPEAGAASAPDRKRFVETRLDERYRPREVREILAKYGDKADVALEGTFKEHNDLIKRLMKQQAEGEWELQAAQTQLAEAKKQNEALTSERDEYKAKIEAETAKERSAQIQALLDKRFGALALRHEAYLLRDGYALDLNGEGDKARVMLVKDGKRHELDTILNDDWYSRYEDARPSGDDPLPEVNNRRSTSDAREGSPAATGTSSAELARLMREADEATRKRTQIPGVS